MSHFPLQEVFATPFARSVLCRQIWLRQQLEERGFVHQVVSPFRVGLGYFTDSGLLIASKLPVLESGFERFHGGAHIDAGAAKGIMYAKLQVGSRQLYVFNTHLQASHSATSPAEPGLGWSLDPEETKPPRSIVCRQAALVASSAESLMAS